MTSPSSPTIPRRRLSSRRGSVSAPDPYAKHGEINLNPNRFSTSTLTIVKVVATPSPSDSITAAHSAFANASISNTISLKDPPLPGHRRSHRRIGSNEGARGRPEAPGGSPRMSFAFSSFGPRTSQSDGTSGRTPSPSSTPPSPSRHRPASPGGNRSSTSGYTAPKPKLTPDQLYDLAHQATNSHYLPLSSPSIHRGSPRLSGSPRPSSSAGSFSAGTAPATFTPLHPSIYLPFVDRTAEVKALIESTPTRKLFALLKQTFPKSNSVGSHSSTAQDIKSPASPAFAGNISSTSEIQIPSDPKSWSFDHLICYITTTSREQEPDTLWAMKVRTCVISHSELIWERIKGALGVPPELDVDFDFALEMNADVFESSESESDSEREIQTSSSLKTPRTDDMEDAGMKARGYWEGWDAVMESPVFDRSSAPSSALASALTPAVSPSAGLIQEPLPMKVTNAILPPHNDLSGSGQTTVSPTPVDNRSRDNSQAVDAVPILDVKSRRNEKFNAHSSLGSFSSLSSSSYPSMSSLITSPPITGPNPQTGVIIEPLIISQSQSSITSPGLNPPPLSLPTSLADPSGASNTNALGDILEGAEEEEDEEKDEKTKDQKKAGSEDPPSPGTSSESAIDPAQIHGLRISLPSSSMIDGASSNPSSPVFSLHRPFSELSQNRPESLTSTLSRSNSLSHTRNTDPKRLSWGSVGIGASLHRSQSVGQVGSGLMRTGSAGSITSIRSYGHPAPGYSSDHSSHGSGPGVSDWEGGYDPVGDRSPGNPLFPSNFARLATGPTLIANNPALRSPPMPPPSKYPYLLHSRKNKFKRSGSSASGVSAATSNDYAITVGSNSSAVGELAE
ncbi:hypothetical protein GYMLUDRAFT_42669 [Collybiopsis luxurians FD-317 M1]|uniref:Uncharacterized protein n=1 Tax=Collybiopsis luxurians FD-317 M1 TaxID=944289 RepID=A0A0D0BD87_9AGAR|nr:hypothetical protein GYMLUDRAFT_42669 [Collybiopsis luxurians FD-317 M1]